MMSLFAGLVLAVLLAVAPAQRADAQSAPEWMRQSLPEDAVKAVLEEQKAVMNPKGALDGKTKQLIGLGVAAQIPCQYCIYGHTAQAKAAGATDAEIKEAIAAAALTRQLSTVLYGTGYDFGKFKQQIDAAIANK